MWKFLVKQQKIEVLEREVIADHQIEFVNLKFTFDGDWKKFHKVVQFSQCDEIYSIVLGFDGTSCKLPAELHAGAVKVSVFGYDAESDTTVRATTVPITLNIRESGFVGDDDTPIPPTPDLYTQLLQKIAEIQSGVNGKDGLSAYEIAVKNGFVGTVSEWLEGLKGADGLPGKDGINGTDGVNGRNGADGKTVELRVYNNELQYRWLDSFGHDVSMWTHLFLLTDLNGKSAYEVAVGNGFTGSEEEWLQSITPDLSPYITRVEVLKIVDDKVHSSAPDLSPYVTRVETQKLIESKFQTVENDLNSLENTVNSEIQSVKDSVEPVVSQAHWHHNLTLLNSLTSAKIAKWDSISDFELRLQSLRDDVMDYQMQINYRMENADKDISEIQTDVQQLRDSTQYDQQNQNDTILSLENRIAVLESQIASANNRYTVLFEYGTDAIRVYGYYIGLVLNGGFFTMKHFAEQYTHFSCPDNHYAMYYGQEDFNWDAQILTCVEKRLKLDENSKIQFRYTSGATEDGELYLITPPGGKIDVPITLYARSEIDNGRAIRLDFQWLKTEKFITTETDCTGITAGEYYLAWVGRSNNTHPTIQSVKVKESV